MEFVSDTERKFSIAEARVAAKLDLWNAPQVRTFCYIIFARLR